MSVKHNRWMTILSAILSALASLFSNFKLPLKDDESETASNQEQSQLREDLKAFEVPDDLEENA